MLPVYPFAYIPCILLGSFGFKLDSSVPLALHRGTSTSVTRCLKYCPVLPNPHPATAPRQGFHPLGSKRFARTDSKNPLSRSTRLPFAPRRSNRFINSICGSSFRARCFPLSSLFHHPSLFSALPPLLTFSDASPKAISRRTSYIRVRLEFLRYPQLIPCFFNSNVVRSSTRFYPRFNLAMDRSPGFGSTACN